MKNITVSVDDESYRRARIRAAEQGVSVSALVREFLREVTAGESEFERLKRLEVRVREEIARFSAADRLPRDAIHQRRP